jgi:hypothetical protein
LLWDNTNLSEEVIVVERIFHPVSGEVGYFCTESQKTLIDAILNDYSMNQLVTSANGRGEFDE